MSVEELKAAVKKLSKAEQHRFRKWYFAFDAAIWDEKLEADIKAGKLDKMADEALLAFKEGKCQEL